MPTQRPNYVQDCSCTYVHNMEKLRQQLPVKVRDLWLQDFSVEFREKNLKQDQMLFKSHGLYGPPKTYNARLRHLAALFIANAHVEVSLKGCSAAPIYWIELSSWMANQGIPDSDPRMVTPERIARAANPGKTPRLFINGFQINTRGKGGEIITFRRESIARLLRAVADSKGQIAYSTDLAPGAFNDMYGEDIMYALRDVTVRVCNLYAQKAFHSPGVDTPAGGAAVPETERAGR
jgi:hypothetical protein